jgi:glutaminyl-tRNA synthetase
VEASVLSAEIGKPFQFEREGYFCADSRYFTRQTPVFNRTVGLRDTWTKTGA